jgi:DNA-binding NarL/FixJ family response regulator
MKAGLMGSLQNARRQKVKREVYATSSPSAARSPRASLLLIDSHEVFRGFTIRYLNTVSDRISISTASGADDGVTLAQTLQPQIILLDLTKFVASGLAVIPYLQRAAPTAYIIALTIHDDLVTRDDALRAGAHDFLIKQRLTDQLMPAILHHLPPLSAAGRPPDIAA